MEALHSETCPRTKLERPRREMQFCELFLHKCDEREDFQDSFDWSDEVTFKIIVQLMGIILFTRLNPHTVEEKAARVP